MTRFRKQLLLLAVFALALSTAFVFTRISPRAAIAPPKLAKVNDPLSVVLTPLIGDDDPEIRKLQAKIAATPDHNALLERLGWAFVAKARLSSDPGFYTLAEQAAKAITASSPNDPAAALLLGHVCDAEHRFAEAEKIARDLTSRREFVFDYALLGDALMEQGKLGEAVEAYQKMVDLKPCLQTYSRVAHMRWLTGDLAGAIEASHRAVSAGSPREPEASAWACTRLASYQIQTGEIGQASNSVDLALQLAPDYAPALLVRGKVSLLQSKNGEAIASLRKAAEISPLPDYLWTLADALRGSGEAEEANRVEDKLVSTGLTSDPRTCSLFLSSRGREPELALRLAQAELKARQDIFSYDALAWAQLASGHLAEAQQNITRALAEGTKDARLFYHAGAIAAAAGENARALEFLNKAHANEKMLLPSERQALGERTAVLMAATPQLSSK